jgi:hypothetical protein
MNKILHGSGQFKGALILSVNKLFAVEADRTEMTDMVEGDNPKTGRSPPV